MFKKLSIITTSLLMTGCATVFSGTSQTINVQAVDESNNQIIPNTICTITDGKGGVYTISSNPGSTVINKGRGSLETRCRAKGYRQKQVGVGQDFNAWTVANVIFWPGLLVDAATGAIQKYPSHITVLMEKVK